MKMRLKTKLKVDTKVAVALAAGAVVLAAAAAGGFSMSKSSRGGFFSTQGYGSSNGSFIKMASNTPTGYTKANPGDMGVIMGKYAMKPVGSDAVITDVNFPMFVQDIPSAGVYPLGADGPVVAADHLTNCLLRDTATNTVISGPIFAPFAQPDLMMFGDDFSLSSGTTLEFNVECDFTKVPANGSQDNFAIDAIATWSVAATDPSGSNNIPLVLSSSNGNPPDYYVKLF